jgi:hypothetical protein
MAVLPSADSATEMPCWAFPIAPVPTSLIPWWLQTPLLWVKTQVAPTPVPALELSSGPPTMAVLPSPDSATETPCWAFPTAPAPTSFDPCCCCPGASCNDLRCEIGQNRAAYPIPERLRLNNSQRKARIIRRGRAKNNLDTSTPPTTYNEGHKQANRTVGGIGTDRCRVGSAISALRSANAPLRGGG